MRIHPLSDLHLTGNDDHVIPEDLDFDVLVVAGDLAEDPARGIEFLKAIGKPCVLVLGNHDYWSGQLTFFSASKDAGFIDMRDRLAQWKQLAAGTQIHVLERESIVLEAGGQRVRFLGATLWTSYGNGNRDLMLIGYRIMNDTHLIGARSVIDGNKRLKAAHDKYPMHIKSTFIPEVPLHIHRQTVAWLDRQLKKNGDWDRTVVVTHHLPSWELLFEAGIHRDRQVLDPSHWQRHNFRPDHDELRSYKVAAYASPLEPRLKSWRRNVSLWCCGHIHVDFDCIIEGVRIVSNATGRWGPRKIIDLGADFINAEVIQTLADKAVGEIAPLFDDLQQIADRIPSADEFIGAVLLETFELRANKICDIAVAVGMKYDDTFEDAWLCSVAQSLRSPVWFAFCENDTDIREKIDDTLRRVRKSVRMLRNISSRPGRMLDATKYLAVRAVRRLAAAGIHASVEVIEMPRANVVVGKDQVDEAYQCLRRYRAIDVVCLGAGE